MDHEKIKTYEQAVDTINKVGFMPLSKNPYAYVSLEGITNFSNWHTGSIYDPWTWKDKIAFKKRLHIQKLFSSKPIFTSWEWYPVFLACFRPQQVPEEFYEMGELSQYAKQIYGLLKEQGVLNTHEIKSL